MSETAVEVPQDAPQEQQAEEVKTAEKPLGEAGEGALAKERDARKAADKRARDLEKELNTFRQASMSESEKAVSEAEARGRTAAQTEASRDLARAKFDAIAARRNPALDDKALDGLLEFIDMGKFLDEDGRPDAVAIRKAAEKLIPAASDKPAPLDLGEKRQAPTSQSMNDALRKAAGRA